MARRRPRPDWPRGMRRDDAADYIGVSVGVLERLVTAGEVLPPRRLTPGCPVYLRDHLDTYLDRSFGLTEHGADRAAGTPDPAAAEWDMACGGSGGAALP